MRQDSSAALRDLAAGLLAEPPSAVPSQLVDPPGVPSSLAELMTIVESLECQVLVHRTAPGHYVAYVGRPPAQELGDAPMLVSGDLTPYAADVAQTIAAAVGSDEDAHVMLVGAASGGVVAAELAARTERLPFVVDQVVTAGSPAAQVPRLPAETRMLALEDRADPVALLGSLVSAGDANRTTVVFDTAGSSSESVYVAGARAADGAPELAAELDRLRLAGFMAPVPAQG
jgi:pimeloyl-ACP methyl ester carboxylesterase